LNNKPAYSHFHESLKCELEDLVKGLDAGLAEKKFQFHFELILSAEGVPKSAERDELVAECASLAKSYLTLFLQPYLEFALNACFSLSMVQVLRIKAASTDLPGNLNDADFIKSFFEVYSKNFKFLASMEGKGRPKSFRNDSHSLKKLETETLRQMGPERSKKPRQMKVAETLGWEDRGIRKLLERSYEWTGIKTWTEFLEKIKHDADLKDRSIEKVVEWIYEQPKMKAWKDFTEELRKKHNIKP
jgi:hypothetical protein